MGEQEPQNQGQETPKSIDEQFTDYLIGHIDNPCEFESGGVICDPREVYLEEARKTIDQKRVTDPKQIERLEKKIQEYKSAE